MDKGFQVQMHLIRKDISDIVHRQDQLDKELLEVANMISPVPAELEALQQEVIGRWEERSPGLSESS